MLLSTSHAQLELADDEVARLRDACDSSLEVTDGFVWLTIAGDREDVVLARGDSFVVDTAEMVTVSALRGAAALRVRANVGTQRCRHLGKPAPSRRVGRLQQMLARLALSSDAVA